MRPGRSLIPDDIPYTGTEGHWDSPAKVVCLGLILPVTVLVWCVTQLYWGQVATIDRAMHSYIVHWSDRASEPGIFWGVLLLEVSISALLCTIYVIGNHPRLGWHTEGIALVFLITAALGLLMTLLGAAL